MYLPFSFIAFGAGVAFGYYVLIPEGLSYLAAYANPSLVSVNITLEFYLALFLLLTLMLGAVFQLPLLMRFMASAGIFTPRHYSKYRRYALLLAVVLGAALTPPDPVTQILLASPIFFLYELGIWLSRMTVRAKKKEAEE
jgi:sec-independent protein translocase protein TatC